LDMDPIAAAFVAAVNAFAVVVVVVVVVVAEIPVVVVVEGYLDESLPN